MGCFLAIPATAFVLLLGLLTFTDGLPLLIGAALVSIVAGYAIKSGCALVFIPFAAHAAFLTSAAVDSTESLSGDTPAIMVLAFTFPLIWLFAAAFTIAGMLPARAESRPDDVERPRRVR